MNIHCIENFFTVQDFWATCAFPAKQSLSWNFHCIEYSFYIQDFWATCACPEKQSPLKFSTVLNFLVRFRIFGQLALALKNRVCPEIFYCVEYPFYIQDFWAICACPEKQSAPWINCTEYIFFIIQDFRGIALALKIFKPGCCRSLRLVRLWLHCTNCRSMQPFDGVAVLWLLRLLQCWWNLAKCISSKRKVLLSNNFLFNRKESVFALKYFFQCCGSGTS